MYKETLLTLLSALRVEIIAIVIFMFLVRFGLRKKIPQRWLSRIFIGWVTITFTTLFVFIYIAYAHNGQHA